MNKKSFKFSMMLLAVAFSMSFISCGSDDKSDDGSVTAPVATPVSLADRVSGTYSGQLTLGTSVREDAYIIKITKLTDSTVSVWAKFFPDDVDNTMNFNLSESAGQIVFSNQSISDFSMYLTGSTLIINYLSNGGNMLTYTGTK